MRGFHQGLALLLMCAACARAPMQSGQTPDGAIDEAAVQAPATWLEARSVEIEPAASGRRVVIALSREPEQIQESWLSAPPRLVIDLTGPRPEAPTDVSRYPLTDDLVPQVRVGPHGASLRAVLDFARQPGTHTVSREGMNLIIELADASEPAPRAAVAGRAAAVAKPAAEPGSPASAPAAPAASESASTPWLAVRDVRLDQADGGRRLMIDLTRSPEGWKDFVLDNPPRLVIDLKGPQPQQPPKLSRFPIQDDHVTGVRAAWNNGVLRVVVDWRDKVGSYQLTQDGTQLVAKLQGGPVAAIDLSDTLVLAPAVVEKIPPAAAAGRKAKTVPVGDEFTTSAAAAPKEEAAPAAEPPPPPAAPAPEIVQPESKVEPLAERVIQPVVASVPKEKPAHPAPAPRLGFNGQRISLDFKDADIQNVLRVLADVSGLNIIATDDVKGKVTLHLTDVPWDQALDLVMRSNRLEMMREGNVVRISTVNRLKEEREALRAAQDAERELEALRVRYVRVNYARADDALVDKVKGVLTDRGSVTFDERTNTVIVRDIGRGIEDASELVRQLDVQSPQVLIEANIVEATESFARALGIQWGYQYNQGPLTGNPTGSNFPGTVGVGGAGLGAGVVPPGQPGTPPNVVPFIADFPVPSGFNGAFGPGAGSAVNLALGSLDGSQSITARLTALEEQGKGRVISRPRVITMNNVAATIQSLTILRVKLPSTGTVINTGTGGAAGSASSATEKINTGITLVVTPQISADGYVLMSIYAKSSQPDFSRTVDGIPNEISREANSNVLIQDGNTVVLGGIFRQTADDRESGLPYLRRIPALGWLFKRMLKSKQNDELLVFLTPKIVSTGTGALPVAERLWEERRQGG